MSISNVLDVVHQNNAPSAVGGPVPTEVLEAAKNNWKLFPIKLATKGEALVPWKREASSDVDQINKWFIRWGETNWGCSMGPSQLLGLDSDTPEGEAAIQAMNLPPTFTVKSGNPDPWRNHYYFVLPPGVQIKSDSSKKKFAFDIKSTGGMFVFPPSIHPESGKPYRILDGRKAVMAPDHLIEAMKNVGLLIDPNAVKDDPVALDDVRQATSDEQRHAKLKFKKACDNFAALPEDSDGHDQLLRIGRVAGGYIATGCFDLDFAEGLAHAACAVWYTKRRGEREIKRVFLDGVRDGLTRPLYPGPDANDVPWAQVRTPEEAARRRQQIEENINIGTGVDIVDCPVADVISLDYMAENFVKIMDGKRVVDMNRPRRI
jgi:hypothetical protein